jgi:glycosyltransferase involved in cell wall biosynthesis
MTIPALSVIVPTFNEERCIREFLERVSAFLESQELMWEIVVVDDGSSDQTVARVEHAKEADARIRLLTQPHRGKGAAVRKGMLGALGAWRLMTDADLSVAPDEWATFLGAAVGTDAEVIVGSREAAGSRRIGEPLSRHLIGRIFNWVVRLFVLPGIQDTQCGFKLLRADAARDVFPHVITDGFAFDVELLFLARRAGFLVREVGVVWVCRKDSRVSVSRGAAAFVDVLRIRLNAWRGAYRSVHKRQAVASTGNKDHAF